MRRTAGFFRFAASGGALLLAAGLVVLSPRLQARQPGGASVAAASENDIGAREAVAQMRAGGTAVDGAVTAALVAGVASPTSSGLGGGGFVVVWDAVKRAPMALDFRETAPAGIDVAAFEKRPFAHAERARATGVPGELAGLWEIHQRFGKRAWKDLVEPARRLADGGFPVGIHLGNMLGSVAVDLQKDPGLAGVFYPNGKPAVRGNLVKRPKLAATLARIAAEGPKAFYEGAIAADLVASARAAGGALETSDLAAYRPVERTPLHVRWEGWDVYTMPPPSAGGLMLAETLGMLTRAELRKLGDGTGAEQHLLAETMRGAIADRMRVLGDPDHEKFDLQALLAPERLAARRKRIALDRTHAIARFVLDEHGTHAITTADAAGSVVSFTTTVNNVFGCKLSSTESGIVLNDELDDFTARSAVAPFGLSESPNRPRPLARPVSSMTPTVVVKDGSAVLGIGGSGGMVIATGVTQLLVTRLAFGKSPADLVKQVRFQVPTRGAFISFEPTPPRELVLDLESRGEIVGQSKNTTSAVQIIAIENGRKLAAADPRKHGLGIVK